MDERFLHSDPLDTQHQLYQCDSLFNMLSSTNEYLEEAMIPVYAKLLARLIWNQCHIGSYVISVKESHADLLGVTDERSIVCIMWKEAVLECCCPDLSRGMGEEPCQPYGNQNGRTSSTFGCDGDEGEAQLRLCGTASGSRPAFLVGRDYPAGVPENRIPMIPDNIIPDNMSSIVNLSFIYVTIEIQSGMRLKTSRTSIFICIVLKNESGMYNSRQVWWDY